MSDPSDRAAAVHAHLDREFSNHLERTRQCLRQPSISADGTGIDAMASWLADRLQDLGAHAEVVPTPGYPVVYGEIDAGAPRTLMIYGMYDTMPVAGESWKCDPFAADILSLPGLGPCLVARGAENSKGSLMSCINMLDSWRHVHGAFPVNLKFILDGEEELGSPSLPAFVEANKARLTANAGLFPSLSQDRYGKPIMKLGFKGILFLELHVRGGEWGGPLKRAVHSSRAVWYSSPTIVLVQALASLFSPDQQRILIDGFYDGVAPLPAEDEPLLDSLAQSFRADVELGDDQVGCFKWDLTGIDLLKKYLYEPSLNIDGLMSGDMDEGAKTILPHDAHAKLDFRFVPNQRAETILNQLRAHFRRAGFPQVEVHLHDTTLWSRTRASSPVVQAAIQACRDLDCEPEIWPLQAGGSPMFLFTETLEMPVVPMGLGHGGGAHGPNEYVTVEGLRLCEKSLASFLDRFASSVDQAAYG